MFPTFDPYYQWLGIPPHLQPPHHYRLLGLELFESHLDVILAAADRQMAHVRMFQLGPYAEFSQQLLNELAAARVCLLSPERKAAYDAELRKSLSLPDPSESFEFDIPDNPRQTVHAKETLESELKELSPPILLSPSAPSPLPAKAQSLRHEPMLSVPLHRTLPVSSVAELPVDPPPPVPWVNEPPYLAEYRRRFFETLVKIILFAFFLVIALMLFSAFALPWLKEGLPRPEAKVPASGPSASPLNEQSPPPPPPSAVETSDNAEGSETMSFVPSDEDQDEKSKSSPVAVEKRLSKSKEVEQPCSAEFFVGCWRIYENGRYVSSITLQPDFSARNSLSPTFNGEWAYDNNEARITWNDGWHVVLRREGDKVQKASYAPKDTAEFHPLDEGTATKEEAELPSDKGVTDKQPLNNSE